MVPVSAVLPWRGGLLDKGDEVEVTGIAKKIIAATFAPMEVFIIAGAMYGAVRYGVPAVARGAVAVEHGAARAVRWALHPLASSTKRINSTKRVRPVRRMILSP